MKMYSTKTEEYPQADRQYKDRLFRFIFQRPARPSGPVQRRQRTDYSDPGALEINTLGNPSCICP